MRSIKTDQEIFELSELIFKFAKDFKRTLPEIRFFILDGLEFASLLEKNVYPTSPINIWEGKRMVNKKHRIETGEESTLYYEVVQPGNPSYAYLNSTNSALMQASVIAHVCGHCEFSELNVLKDSTPYRTEYVMHLVNNVNLARFQMGDLLYMNYWNACESAVPLIAPHSQYSLANSVETETKISHELERSYEEPTDFSTSKILPISETLTALLRTSQRNTNVFEEEMHKKQRQESLSRKGYTLKAPCQDVLGFLRYHAPASRAERSILDYLYITHLPYDFVLRTQIMNEGWAMYWEKKLMHELFKANAVKGIIDYARVFSGVCYPRPYWNRNPYHLGFHMWTHIEELFRDGKISLDYVEETDMEKKENWKVPTNLDPVARMTHLVSTITDYEFLRRFLTPALVHEFHLNRIFKPIAKQLGIREKDIVKADEKWVWINPEPIKNEMLKFFTHFYRPRIYIIDTEFEDGTLLLYHRNDGRGLRNDWIRPTLKNLNIIWKAPVGLISKDILYVSTASQYKEIKIYPLTFEQVVERMQKKQKPFKME